MENNKNPKRLLCIVGSMNAGGAETFLMKVYRALDKTRYQMDFYTMSMEKGFYEEEIRSLGGKVYHSTPKTENLLKSFLMITNTVKRGEYDYVMRVSEHSLSTIDLVAAKIGGAKYTIFRSSNSKVVGGRVSKLLHGVFKILAITIPTIKIAPSTEAAEFMFGKNCVKKGKVNIVKNAISIENFLFKEEKRKKIRKQLKIEDKFVVGHVGRFNHQKNHDFLIDIFSRICKKHDNSVLILVGKGELENEIKVKVNALGLEDKVIFTGVRSDIPDIMMAMDIYVFPSLFEGMPNTVIEAQATSLPCIISDTITKEAQITDLVTFISINDASEKWSDTSLQIKERFDRKNMKKYFIDNGYDITLVTRGIESLIFDMRK